MKKIKLLILLLAVLLLVGCNQRHADNNSRNIISTPEQLRQMDPDCGYVLATDIDLGGEIWRPMDFRGHLDGDGHKISNFTLSQSVNGNLGFFATNTGSVWDLHLENVTLCPDGNTQFAGMIAGTNRGSLLGCTVTGTIIDDAPDRCLGVLVGKNEGEVSNGKETLAAANLLTGSADSGNPQDQVSGLSAILRLELGADQKIGIAGQTAAKDMDKSMIWQDVSASFESLPEAQQQLRSAVVDKMYQMGTVQWTPSEEISYTANGNRKSTHSNVYLPGRTYIGIPYNGCEGSYERFLSVMQPQADSDGRLVTVTGLENGIKNKDGSVSGFILHMGNDCVGAVIWALAAGVPYDTAEGGMEFTVPINMVPNDYNRICFGALPAGGYAVLPSDETKYPDGLDARDTKAIIDRNGGPEAMAEFYAKAYRGDYLICVRYSYDPETDTWKRTANHGRVLAYEPVIIRDWDGTVDLNKSYAITHEQGDGLYDNRLEDGQYETYKGYNLKQTSWRTDYIYSLSLLLTESGYNSAYLPGTGFGYVPVTLGAYTQETVAAFTCRETAPVMLPNTGEYEANYLMTTAKMTITDDRGKPVYEKTAWLPYRVFTDFKHLKLAELFPDATENLIAGQTYYETLVVTATGGRTCTVLENQAFTY